ncbi:MAG: CAP domain-containing protein [bacterium]|nr:CAP domain-containing protein [Candidatus Kapabacteria bacterium]
MRKYLLPALLALFFASCSDDSPTGPYTPIVPTFSNNPVPLTDIYDELPDVSRCFEGKLKASEAQKVLSYVNQIRALHGLLPAEYRTDDNVRTAKASLIIAASSSLTHFPQPSAPCYSQEAYDGSSTSNIAYRSGTGTPSETFVDMWLADVGVASLGHRRWIIDPFLRYISFGRCDRASGGSITGSAIKVIYGEQRDISATATDFVAYPYHDYPARLLPNGAMLSLSVVASRTNKGASGGVDYSAATITMTSDAGVDVAATDITSDRDGYGLANNLRWKGAGLVAGTRYNVEVKNVIHGGSARNYSWWFTLVQ